MQSFICTQYSKMGWLRLVGSLQLYVFFAKEPYKRDYILHKRPMILRSLLTVATPYPEIHTDSTRWDRSALNISRSRILSILNNISRSRDFSTLSNHTFICINFLWFIYTQNPNMGWVWLVGSWKMWVSFAEYSLFYRALLQKRRCFQGAY